MQTPRNSLRGAPHCRQIMRLQQLQPFGWSEALPGYRFIKNPLSHLAIQGQIETKNPDFNRQYKDK
jgi:hypothetical protein